MYAISVFAAILICVQNTVPSLWTGYSCVQVNSKLFYGPVSKGKVIGSARSESLKLNLKEHLTDQ